MYVYLLTGSVVQSPGTPCGDGLCESAAVMMGLKKGMPVGTSILDAHAGVLGDSSLTLYI
jgi:ribulose kinase